MKNSMNKSARVLIVTFLGTLGPLLLSLLFMKTTSLIVGLVYLFSMIILSVLSAWLVSSNNVKETMSVVLLGVLFWFLLDVIFIFIFDDSIFNAGERILFVYLSSIITIIASLIISYKRSKA